MAEYGAGSMREASPGTWYLRVYAGRDRTTGNPRQVHRTFKGTEKEARKELARLVTEVQDGKVGGPTSTFGQLLDRWLEHIEPTRRPKTLHEYRAKIDKRIRPALGSKKLAKLSPHDIDVCYREWGAEGLSPTSVHHLHTIMSAALNQAVKWGWIDRNPAARATAPPLRTKSLPTPLPEQVNKIHAAAKDDNVLATAIALAALTGARRGELCALRWSDVDLGAQRLNIARSLTVVGGKVHEGPTKTHQVRSVALDETGVRVLRDRWEYMTQLAECADVPLCADPYVLSYLPSGVEHVGPDTITHRFAAVCKKVGVECRFHDLRHFSATTLIAAGVDVRTVAERLGHAQATMTLNRYAHALPERDREAAGVLGVALALGAGN